MKGHEPSAGHVCTGLRMAQTSKRVPSTLSLGLKFETMDRIVAARTAAVFDSAEDLARGARVEHAEMKLLATADALMSLSGHRRQQVWDASALRSTPELPREATFDEAILELPGAPEGSS